jgi:peptide/nickel transport system substrate-binding protein
LVEVRRFVFAWITLLVLLISGLVIQTRGLSHYYQVLKPAAGGTFTEGVLGTFTNANPLYAVNAVDSSVSHLVFSGLLRYDQKGQLVGDLAEKWSTDARGAVYTVVLRKNLIWHDGNPLTAADVVFTYETIQNPDAKSPLLTSWQGIKVQAVDALTVTFTVPNSLAAFPNSLTNGIVPKHLLGDIPTSQLRSIRFNTAHPVGSGPFKWETIEVNGTSPETREERIALLPNEHFYRTAPKLERFIIRAFHDEQHLFSSLAARQLNGATGFATIPDTLLANREVHLYNIPLNGEVVVFFKTSLPIFSDPKVRQALVKAIDVADTVKKIGYPVVVANSPLLKSQVGYDKNIVQSPHNMAEANQLLDAAGWVRGKDGIRVKAGTRLHFQLTSQNTSEYTAVAQALQSQWKSIGVDAEVVQPSSEELQAVIPDHNFDALLYGISIGPDPDVFPYWHSSQADPRSSTRLNFSEYKSKQADVALEAGRTRLDPGIRTVKYRPFLEAWRNDAPALALYQPRLLYVTYGNLFNFEPKVVNSTTDRYSNVENWMILEEKTNK